MKKRPGSLEKSLWQKQQSRSKAAKLLNYMVGTE